MWNGVLENAEKYSLRLRYKVMVYIASGESFVGSKQLIFSVCFIQPFINSTNI